MLSGPPNGSGAFESYQQTPSRPKDRSANRLRLPLRGPTGPPSGRHPHRFCSLASGVLDPHGRPLVFRTRTRPREADRDRKQPSASQRPGPPGSRIEVRGSAPVRFTTAVPESFTRKDNTINTEPQPPLHAYTAIDVATELRTTAGRQFVRTCIQNTATGNDYGLMSTGEILINRRAHQANGRRTGIWEVPRDLIDTDTLLIVTVTGNDARARFVNGTTDTATIPIAVLR